MVAQIVADILHMYEMGFKKISVITLELLGY
jgi:hypothetical protein